MTRFEWVWWWITNRIPGRFGIRVSRGVYYDRYYNKSTGKKYLFDRREGKMIDD